LQIVDAVALECGVSRADILGTDRRARIVEARHLAMYAVHDVIRTLSLPVVGRLFGGRDHTTVLHAVRKIEQRLRAGPEYDRRVAALIARVSSAGLQPRESETMEESPWLRLADAIEQRLRAGRRQYTLRGAELDWVIAALRRETGATE
jgi:hypothetical protein